MAQKGTIMVEKTGEVFSGVNVSGSEDSDVIYQPVYEVAGLEGASNVSSHTLLTFRHTRY